MAPIGLSRYSLPETERLNAANSTALGKQDSPGAQYFRPPWLILAASTLSLVNARIRLKTVDKVVRMEAIERDCKP